MNLLRARTSSTTEVSDNDSAEPVVNDEDISVGRNQYHHYLNKDAKTLHLSVYHLLQMT